jgi:inosine-uridine nucleoside N-ribohydrolase
MGKLLIHDHDGHVDDLVACVLLWLAPEADLQAVGITDGHCLIEEAYECLIKIATFLDLEGVEIGLGEELLPNPFHLSWRKESHVINTLPLFSDNELKKPYSQGRRRSNSVMYADCLSHSRDPITFVTTGPLTSVANLLRERSNLADKIAEIYIAGGAITSPGDVHEKGYEGAEWNVFADPKSFKTVLESRVHIKLVPKDVTMQVPVTKALRQKIEKQSKDSRVSLLASKLYALVSGFDYYLSDVLTALIAIDPSLATFKKMRIDVALSGKSTGKISKPFFSGREVEVATAIDEKKFEDVFFELLRAK